MSYSLTKIYDHRLLSTSDGVSVLYGPIRSGIKAGSRVPNWKQLIKESREASSDFSIEGYKYTARLAAKQKFTSRRNSSGVQREWSYSGFPGSNQTFASPPSPDDNKAVSGLHSKLRDSRSQMNGSLFMGELAETVRMLRSPGTSLVHGFFKWSEDLGRRVSKDPSLRGRRNRRNFVDVASGTWLEAVFGWTPFISDVKEIAETVGRIVVDREKSLDRLVSTSESSITPTFQLLTTNDPAFAPSPSLHSSLMDWERRKSASAGVRYVVFLRGECAGPIDSFSRVAQVSGFTLENVVPTIYNLIPYSFLLDYASNLGNCVEAQFTDTSRFAFGTKTVRTKSSVKVISTPNASKINSVFNVNGYTISGYSGSSGVLEEVRTTLQRTRLTAFPLPKLELTITSSGKKIGNVLALLAGSLNRLRG